MNDYIEGMGGYVFYALQTLWLMSCSSLDDSLTISTAIQGLLLLQRNHVMMLLI